jgi:endonuclease/exonuclease/phosphatase family metal-dependent hydrolase
MFSLIFATCFLKNQCMMKKFLLLFFIKILCITAFADTLTIMHYNLLNYGNFTDYCTLYNNPPEAKTAHLKTIIDYYLPDILTVNEMSTNAFYQNKVLAEVLNVSGRTGYARAEATNLAGSDIINMLYYRADKLGLERQQVIATSPRDINAYRLFHRQMAPAADTIFLWVITAHLKAGSSGADKLQRAEMAQAVVDFINNNNITDACMLTGDLNLQNAAEPAWQLLAASSNASAPLTDPTGMEGYWHSNADFASVHTQSTRITSNGCAAGGGIDDRFDFVLVNPEMLQPDASVAYINDSYTTGGQDGLRFNGSVLDPPNYSAPQDVLQAIYQLSDHLPIMVKLVIENPESPLPETWSFTLTSRVHQVAVPMACQTSLFGQPLPAGSYIGAFFLDEGNERCAGYKLWNGTGNVLLKLYGDNPATSQKEGFAAGEPLLFKVLNMPLMDEYYASADYNGAYPAADGLFVVGGSSAFIRLRADYLQSFPLKVEAGWSAVSAFLQPIYPAAASLFGSSMQHIIYYADSTSVYCPQAGLLEAPLWDSGASYLIKSTAGFTINFLGLPLFDKAIILHPGWNLLPVPVGRYVPVEEILEKLGDNLIAIKEVAGSKVFWLEHGINSLNMLIPGRAYFINVNQDGVVIFQD